MKTLKLVKTSLTNTFKGVATSQELAVSFFVIFTPVITLVLHYGSPFATTVTF